MQQDGIDICNAGVEAADILASIGSSSFRDAYSQHSDPADLEAHLRDFFAPGAVRACIESGQGQYLLATVDGQPGGIARYRPAACPVPNGATDALELQQLYVLASMHRHGLGRRLIDALIDVARGLQLTGIWLSCWEDADWAMNFYLKNGFVAVGTADFDLGTTTYCDHLLWRALLPENRKSTGRSRS
jgi:GNAT superfamily N-acetyltransferase